jgi:hypothetical protein
MNLKIKLIASLVVALTSGCYQNEASSPPSIIGTWKEIKHPREEDQSYITYTFNEDGVLYRTRNPDALCCKQEGFETWSQIDNNRIQTIDKEGFSRRAFYEIRDDILEIYWGDVWEGSTDDIYGVWYINDIGYTGETQSTEHTFTKDNMFYSKEYENGVLYSESEAEFSLLNNATEILFKSPEGVGKVKFDIINKQFVFYSKPARRMLRQ